MEITDLGKLEKYAAELEASGTPEEVCRQLAISITAWALADDIETNRDRINTAIRRSLTILAKNYLGTTR